MPFFAFDVDDVFLGADRAIVSRGDRRVMLGNLAARDLAALDRARRSGVLDLPDDARPLMRALAAKDLIDLDAPDRPAAPRPWRPMLPSATVTALSRRLAPLASAPALLTIAALTLAAFAAGLARPVFLFSVTRWLQGVGPLDFAIASLVFAACIAAHELGHAAACYRRTGIVGGMRARLYRGIPVFTTDVSSLCLATPRGRAWIAVAGIIFQLGVSALLLAMPVQSIRIGASMSLLSAAFAIVPLPGADGYWFLSDLFGLRLRGFFGRAGERNWLCLSYTLWLVAVTGWFCAMLVRDARSLLLHGWNLRGAALPWASLFAVVGLYAGVVALLFARRTLIFLRTGETAAR